MRKLDKVLFKLRNVYLFQTFSAFYAEKLYDLDVLCFLIFLAFIGGWVFVAYLGWRDGNISRVVYPTDSQVN